MGMTQISPLPEGFLWETVDTGLRLVANGRPVLHVRRQRRGWVVQIEQDGAPHAHSLVVGSQAAGVRYGNKWARAVTAKKRTQQAPSHGTARQARRVRERRAQSSSSCDSPPAWHELRRRLEELHAARRQLEAAIAGIEVMLAAMPENIADAPAGAVARPAAPSPAMPSDLGREQPVA